MGVTRFAPGDDLATRDDSGWHSLLPDGLAPMPLEEVRRAERHTDEVVSNIRQAWIALTMARNAV
jgi:hypothetical protein